MISKSASKNIASGQCVSQDSEHPMRGTLSLKTRGAKLKNKNSQLIKYEQRT